MGGRKKNAAPAVTMSHNSGAFVWADLRKMSMWSDILQFFRALSDRLRRGWRKTLATMRLSDILLKGALKLQMSGYDKNINLLDVAQLGETARFNGQTFHPWPWQAECPTHLLDGDRFKGLEVMAGGKRIRETKAGGRISHVDFRPQNTYRYLPSNE